MSIPHRFYVYAGKELHKQSLTVLWVNLLKYSTGEMKTSLQHQSLESLPVVLLPKQPESMWEGSLGLACKVIIMTRVIGVFDLKLTIPLKPPVKMNASYHLFVDCVCCLTEMRNYLKNLTQTCLWH